MKSNSAEISMDEWVDALKELNLHNRDIDPHSDGFYSFEELKRKLCLSKYSLKLYMKKLREVGRLEILSYSRSGSDGRHYSIPHYKIKKGVKKT